MRHTYAANIKTGFQNTWNVLLSYPNVNVDFAFSFLYLSLQNTNITLDDKKMI